MQHPMPRAVVSEREQRIIAGYIDSLWLERGLARPTLDAYRTDLEHLAGWLATRHAGLLEASRADLMEHLGWRIGKGYQARFTARLLSCLRGFYRHALRQNLIAQDPTLYRLAQDGSSLAQGAQRD
jgi:integrase/recombinase XerD